MSWHVYRIFRVVALCESLVFLFNVSRTLTFHSGALFCLHSILIGIISIGMLAFEIGGKRKNLQFTLSKLVNRPTKPTKPYSFPWTSSLCSPYSVCTSHLRTHHRPNSYLSQCDIEIHTPRCNTKSHPQPDRIFHPFRSLVDWSHRADGPWCLKEWERTVPRPC
jgi:hypothetical protein